MTTLLNISPFLNRTPSQNVRYVDPLCCPIHAFMLFLDVLAQEKDIEEVSFFLNRTPSQNVR